jgi:hypothetical protein
VEEIRYRERLLGEAVASHDVATVNILAGTEGDKICFLAPNVPLVTNVHSGRNPPDTNSSRFCCE